nr:LOW QUALITY PROTEIN: cholecystokinin receptor type A-like [Penaeus vannamei]
MRYKQERYEQHGDGISSPVHRAAWYSWRLEATLGEEHDLRNMTPDQILLAHYFMSFRSSVSKHYRIFLDNTALEEENVLPLTAAIAKVTWFLVSLAAADLLLLLLCVPLETLQYFLWTPHLSLPVCKLSSYFELLSAVASVLNLTAVSLERYIVIVYPMRSRTFCTLSNCRRAIIGVWIVSLVLSVPAGMTQTVIKILESVSHSNSKDVYSMTYYNATHSVTVYHCATGGDHDLVFAVYRLVIVFLLPALLMSFFYARVIKALWVSTKKMTAMTRVYSTRWDSRHSISSHNSLASCSVNSGLVQPSPSAASGLAMLHAACPLKRCVHRQRSGEEVKQARKQVIKMLILVIILFMACWGPKIVFFVFLKNGLAQGSFKPLVYNMRVALGLLPFIHSCLNPIIYR